MKRWEETHPKGGECQTCLMVKWRSHEQEMERTLVDSKGEIQKFGEGGGRNREVSLEEDHPQ